MSAAKILKHDPLSDTDEILRKEYYASDPGNVKPQADAAPQKSPEPMATEPTRAPSAEPAPEAAATATTAKKKKPKPTHYKVVCISLYTKDIENLEAKVAELKRRGHTKANKSQLIRFALNQLDIDKLPPPNP